MLSLLIDLDGVLRIDSKPAPGVKEFFQVIRKRNVPACILSNTTKLPARTIISFFEEHDIRLEGIKIHTALLATFDYVKQHYKNVAVYCEPLSRSIFDEFQQGNQPECVVIGDLGESWNYELMNDIFNKVMNGADIIAMQMNHFQKTGNGLLLDAGPFIKAIEYATGKEAVVIGKPSKIFFSTALAKLGVNENDGFLMLGDDLQVDIRAAQNAGGKGALVLTGKTDQAMLDTSDVKPDYVFKDLKETVEWLTR